MRQKDNIAVDRGSCDCGKNSPGACLKVDKRSEFLRDKEKITDLIKRDVGGTWNETLQTFVFLIQGIITRDI